MKSAAILAVLIGSATAFAPSAKSAIESESALLAIGPAMTDYLNDVLLLELTHEMFESSEKVFK